MIDWRLYDPKNCPGAGWRWSETLQKWRRDPAPFRFMRAGIHIVAGIAAAFIAPDWQTLAILTVIFLCYERWEAQRIADEAYPDVGGFLTGLMLYYGAVKAWGLFL